MRTTKPIATISFNSEAFLITKLNELTKAGRLSFWAFIPHEPEDDEGGKKLHHHVFAEPSKMLQTDDLRRELMEFDPEMPTKPRGCLAWTSSNFGHWYMYALHDRRYLASKGQTRRFSYTHDAFRTSDSDDLLFRSRSIDLLSLSPYADMEDAQRHGITWPEYFARGTVPLPQVKQFQEAWFLLAAARSTDRGNSAPHPMELPEADPVTGEVTGF